MSKREAFALIITDVARSVVYKGYEDGVKIARKHASENVGEVYNKQKNEYVLDRAMMEKKADEYITIAREEISNAMAALQAAKVRMASIKAPRLAWNLRRIERMGGVENATQQMLRLESRQAKIDFMKSFQGVGDKYGRNVWMDIYDPAFRDAIAVDERIKSVSAAIGFEENNYVKHEAYYCGIAKDAGLEPWEVDRLLYHFKPHFIASIE